MIKRYYKIIISVILVVTLSFAFCTQAHAFVGAAAGAALMTGALSSVGVDLAVTIGATYIGYQMINDWINSGYNLKGILTGVANGYIKVNNDSVTVDGVTYQSIFLSPDMASELHTQAFDFITRNAITSNSSGILAEGVGFIDDLQAFRVNNTVRTQDYTFTMPGQYAVSNSIYTFTLDAGNYPRVSWSNPAFANAKTGSTSSKYASGGSLYLYQNNSSDPTHSNTYTKWSYTNQSGTTSNSTLSSSNNLFVEESFEYDYVAGSIDATPLTSDEGFQVFVPISELQQAGISTGTFINDGGSGTDVISDLIDLLDTINPDFLLNPEFTEVIDPPSPTPTPIPIPTDALGAVPYPDFIDTFGQSVYDRLDNIDDTIDTIGSSINDELAYQSSIVDTIGLAIDSIEDAVTDVVDGIQVKVGEIADTLVDIKEGILEAIEEGPIKLIDSGLDVLRSVFGSILQTIRSHVGIWHYVVSWVQSISIPFNWILGIANSTSYFMVLPLYALVAGTLVIAIYKRFGR